MSDVTLRALEPEDLDLLYRIENDEELWATGPTSVPYSRYSLHDYLSHQSADIYQDRQVRLVIDVGGAAIGLADIVDFDPKHRRAEVGIAIERPYRGRGLGRATLRHLHAYAHGTLGLHQLYAVVAAGNEAALSMFRSTGYAEGTVLRDWLADGGGYRDAILLQKIL